MKKQPTNSGAPKTFLAKYKWGIIVCAAILAFLLVGAVPLWINRLFEKPAKHDIFAVDWKVEDALSYYAAVLGFVGTVSLGAVAVFQTDRANRQTERANQLAQEALVQTRKANDLAKQMQKLEQARFVSMVSLTDVVYEEVSAGGTKRLRPKDKTPISDYIRLSVPETRPSSWYIFDLVFHNSSDYPIIQMTIHPQTCETYNCARYGMVTLQDSAVYIPAHGSAGISISIPGDMLKTSGITKMVLDIDFVNIFDYSTKAGLALENMGVRDKRMNYTYHLAKFINVRPEEEYVD